MDNNLKLRTELLKIGSINKVCPFYI